MLKTLIHRKRQNAQHLHMRSACEIARVIRRAAPTWQANFFIRFSTGVPVQLDHIQNTGQFPDRPGHIRRNNIPFG